MAVPVSNMHELLKRSARLFGDKTAIRQLHSGNPDDEASELTYRQLLDGVQQAANLFHTLGVRDDDAVVLLIPPMIEAHFA
ncbi:MAG: AMP-binding protein, partial [Quisquiliibacterium sp.]